MSKIRNILASCLFFIMAVPARLLAQGTAPEMDTAMVRNGKIYVVVAVLVVIFIGIILFMIRMDRRLNRLEKRQQP